MKKRFLVGLAAAAVAAMASAQIKVWPRVASGDAEGALALADRTYEYVAKAVGEKALREEKRELEADRKWLKELKNPAMRGVVEKELLRLRRRILFKHPDLQFDRLLAVQRKIPYTRENHMVDQYLGRWSRPGPGLVSIENWRTAPKAKPLLEGKLPKGVVMNPDLHWDGDRLLFAFCDHTAKPPADAHKLKVPKVVVKDKPWVRSVDPEHPVYGPGIKADGERDLVHLRFFIYECAADGSWVKQITGGPGDAMKTEGGRQTVVIEDADPCYLPEGGFVFTSTRCQNYGRCHWGRYTPAFLLYKADEGGKNIRPLSFGEANEWEPVLMQDGRLAYTRWDYINRNAIWFQSLWAVRPDGSAVSHLYGNYSLTTTVVTEAKPIPGTRLMVCTAGAHHAITGGSLMILDPAAGEDGEGPVTRLTPEVPFPESEGWITPGQYCSPQPLNDTLYLCSYSDETMGFPVEHPRFSGGSAAWPTPAAFGIWLVDTLGGRELIYKDSEYSTFSPIPVVKRERPPKLTSTLPPRESAPDWGLCYVENVYDCRTELPPGSIKELRINKLYVMEPCKRDTLSQGHDLDLHKESLGTVPVEADGSARFRIPAETPIQLQAVDTNGVAVFTMRSFIYAQKGEVQGCAGCHENKFKSGAQQAAPKKIGERKVHDPKPEVDLGYAGPFSYTKSVQPIFDRKCISCHGLGEGKKPAFSIIGAKGMYGLLERGAVSYIPSYRETTSSKPYDYFAGNSRLWHKLMRGHGGVKLEPEELRTIGLWLDLNAPRFTTGGGYSHNRPEARETDPAGEAKLRAAVKEELGEKVAGQPFEALVNRGMEERSRVLWLVKPEKREKFLELVKGSLKPHPAQDVQGTCGRDDDCRCNSCWVRRGKYNEPQ